MIKYYIVSFFTLFVCLSSVAAQESNVDKWSFDLKAGLNFGGTSPLPIPEEIREIKSFNPGMQLSVAVSATRWLSPKWGLSAGLKLENKGMETDARVKSYYMEVVSEDGGRMCGYWTGDDYTEVDQRFVTFPLLSKWQLSERLDINAGMFFSILVSGDFSGYVSEGYLRKDTPIGEKVQFANGASATYSFGDHFNKFMYGLQAGANFRVWKGLGVFGDLTWGLRDVFESDFDTVTFKMWPIYFNFGLSYTL